MPKRISTARGREFGEGMRAAIANAGMNARELADVLGWDEAKVSDVQTGKGGVTILEVALILGVCRVEAKERDRLLELFPGRDLSGWWQPHGKCAPVRPRTVLTQLTAAETLISWHTHAVWFCLRPGPPLSRSSNTRNARSRARSSAMAARRRNRSRRWCACCCPDAQR